MTPAPGTRHGADDLLAGAVAGRDLNPGPNRGVRSIHACAAQPRSRSGARHTDPAFTETCHLGGLIIGMCNQYIRRRARLSR